MFNWISYRLKLNRLRRRKRRVARAYDTDIARAFKDKKSTEEIESIRYDRHWELGNCDDEIAQLQTDYLSELADIYGVPRPPFLIVGNIPSDGWYESQLFGRYLLTTSGRAQLRSSIRAEKKDRRDAVLPYITLLFALAGAVVGTLTFIYKH